MTNEWLQGYLAALNNVIEAIEKMDKETSDGEADTRHGYFNVKMYVRQVKKNYKDLVEELNAKSENKKTSS
jgi:hypothetical protein